MSKKFVEYDVWTSSALMNEDKQIHSY